MKFTDLPKQKRLLIYMFYYEAESSNVITMSKNGDDIIAYGISKNKTSLANMLYNLRKKKLVSETILKNGSFAYSLTASGQDEAKRWIERYDKDDCLPDNVEQPSKNEEAVEANWTSEVDYASLANMFADIAKNLSQQPSQTNKLQEENDALAEEVKSLQNANRNIRIHLNDICNELDVKNKECERLKNGLDQIANTFKQLADWTINIKKGYA